LLSTGKAGPAIVADGEHTWPGSREVMGWRVADDGLAAIFSRDIPRLVASRLRSVADDFLARHALAIGDIDRFVCHPGGIKVVGALEICFGLGHGALRDERAVLRDYGNMSAASVIFVLDRALADPRPWRRALLTALGPGFTAGFLVLDQR
jgi:alkylresorcinol/alkylpyrone synthase